MVLTTSPYAHYSAPMQQSSLSIENILGSDGMLSRYIPGFETRSSQLEMARLIAAGHIAG